MAVNMHSVGCTPQQVANTGGLFGGIQNDNRCYSRGAIQKNNRCYTKRQLPLFMGGGTKEQAEFCKSSRWSYTKRPKRTVGAIQEYK